MPGSTTPRPSSRPRPQGAQEALGAHPSMLESLRLAGVVDAGGRGLVVILDALAEVVSGIQRAGVGVGPHLPFPRPVDHEATAHYGGPAYEVMFLLDAVAERGRRAPTDLDGLGDSLVDGRRRRAVERPRSRRRRRGGGRGRPASRPPASDPHHAPRTGAERPGAQAGTRAVVAVTHGPGVAELLGDAGVHVCPAAAARQRPSTGRSWPPSG